MKEIYIVKADIIAGFIHHRAFGHRKVVGLIGAFGLDGIMDRLFKELVGLGSVSG
jgi:hypothetical protein